MAEIVWAMLSGRKDFAAGKMQGKYIPLVLAGEAICCEYIITESRLVR